MTTPTAEVPRGNAAGFRQYLRYDVQAGFLVFLIALPLCLGISLASGYPPLAGVFTAIIGALLTTLISDAELTIKGPAAGLVVIAIGCIEEFGGDGAIGGFSAADVTAYRMALAVGVAAAVLQIGFGLFRAGILGEFFPASAVHGMLAAIGVIIIAKQFPVALGVEIKGEPLELLREIPHIILEANPAIALIGLVSMLIMFLWPLLRQRLGPLGTVPAPMVVLLVAVPLGMAFDLMHAHSYYLQGHKYQLGEQYLVAMPSRVLGMFDQLTLPDFSALTHPSAWKWVFMFFAVGSLESLLSAKAVELLDPWKRRTNLDRDLVGVGVANLACAMVGGLPMISEIVRSKANLDYGARTRFANLWHGVFLLVCVALIPMALHRVPLAALAAMLVYTGFRLAHPREFLHVYHIGREQLLVFVVTLVGVLATDLLIGIGLGIGTKIVIHALNGVPLSSLFRPSFERVDVDERTCKITAHKSAVFSNWIPFRREIENLGLAQRKNVVLDLSDTRLVDHSVMEKLAALEDDFAREGLCLQVVGLEAHRQLSSHRRAARKRGFVRLRRITVTADGALESLLEEALVQQGASGFTAIPCTGAGRRHLVGGLPASEPQIRIETILPADVAERVLVMLRTEIMPHHHVTACLETVEVVSIEPFLANGGSPEVALVLDRP